MSTALPPSLLEPLPSFLVVICTDLHPARIPDMILPLVRVLLFSLCGITNAAPSLSTTDMSQADSRRPSCIQKTGRIFVTSESDAVNGYLSSQPNMYGGYGAVTNTTDDALRISFCKPKHHEGDPHRAVFEIDTLVSIITSPTLYQCSFRLTRMFNLVTRCGVRTGSKPSRS